MKLLEKKKYMAVTIYRKASWGKEIDGTHLFHSLAQTNIVQYHSTAR